jgi:hypothetical protein
MKNKKPEHIFSLLQNQLRCWDILSGPLTEEDYLPLLVEGSGGGTALPAGGS